jgi:hypothetical protein
MNSYKQLMLVIAEMVSFFSSVCIKRCWMYTVHCTDMHSGFCEKCSSDLLFTVNHHGHLLYSFCVFVLLTQRRWLDSLMEFGWLRRRGWSPLFIVPFSHLIGRHGFHSTYGKDNWHHSFSMTWPLMSLRFLVKEYFHHLALFVREFEWCLRV